MDVLVTIGEFSRMTHLSVKALRHYHDVGILTPADVDGVSGYRRYAATQVAAAQLIRRLRDLEMPLDDVRTVLAAADVDTRNAAITAHLARMEQRLEQTRATVASLRALLDGERAAAAITIRHIDTTPAIAIEGSVAFDDCDSWLTAAYEELEAARAAAHLALTGPAGALYPAEFFEAETGAVVAYLPVAPATTVHLRGRVTRVDLPAADFAVLVHRGAFADLDRAYGSLGAAVAEQGIGAAGPIRERYLVTAADTDDVTAHLTEVCWPVAPRP
jgi:DNA-binding transcriptional MerR regulator